MTGENSSPSRDRAPGICRGTRNRSLARGSSRRRAAAQTLAQILPKKLFMKPDREGCSNERRAGQQADEFEQRNYGPPREQDCICREPRRKPA